MYQALYRKYRPQVFDDVIGQNHITETLKNQVQNDHLSHAYIFIGTRGTGKTTCARILAKAVNCEHPVNGNPCCQCASCRGIADGSIMDIVELDAASNNGVDNVRALREEAVFSPANVKKRVYIIDEVHMLSTPAFNALLKILEEPPEHLIFVLATTELQKVPATILSRCQRHVFKRIDLDVLADYLVSIASKENLNLSHDAAKLIAGLGEGSVRDSLSILDQCSSLKDISMDSVYSAVGLAGNKRISSLYGYILNNDTENAVNLFDTMWQDGKDPAVVLKELSNLNRDVLMLKVAPKSAGDLLYGGYDRTEIEQYAASAEVARLCYIGDELTKTLGSLVNPKMNAELCIVKLSCLGYENIVSNDVKPAKVQQIGMSGTQSPIHAKVGSIPPEQPRTEKIEEKRVDAGASATKQVPVTDKDYDSTLQSSAPQKNLTGDAADLWHNICSSAKPDLPIDIGFQLNDTSVVVGNLDGDTLTIRVAPGFIFSRFNRQEVISVFATAATGVTGRTVQVRVAEMNSQQEKPKRDLGELKNFSDVKFI